MRTRGVVLLVVTAGALTLAGCSPASADRVSSADQATLSSVEATVGAVESQVASDGGG